VLPHNSLADTALILQQMRLRRGWSPETLAQRAGLSTEVIESYESNPESLNSRAALKILDAIPEVLPDGSLKEYDDPTPSQSQEWLMMAMEARMFEFEAALRIDQGRFRVALELLVRARSTSPCRELTAQLLLTQASVLGELHREEQALAALAEAELCLHSQQDDPKLWLRLRLEQIYFLCQRQAYLEAEVLHAEAWELAQRVGRDKERWLARTLKGWIYKGLGQSGEAIATLREIREELLEHGRVFDAAAVTLDLAAVFASLGQMQDIQDLNLQLEPFRDSPKIPKLAGLVLKTFDLVARRGTLSAERGHRLAAEFRQAGGRLTRPYELPR
jgi:tetratricopeptide (TPR) repeat protein